MVRRNQPREEQEILQVQKINQLQRNSKLNQRKLRLQKKSPSPVTVKKETVTKEKEKPVVPEEKKKGDILSFFKTNKEEKSSGTSDDPISLFLSDDEL